MHTHVDVELADEGTRLLSRVLVLDLDGAMGVEVRHTGLTELLLAVDGSVAVHVAVP